MDALDIWIKEGKELGLKHSPPYVKEALEPYSDLFEESYKEWNRSLGMAGRDRESLGQKKFFFPWDPMHEFEETLGERTFLKLHIQLRGVWERLDKDRRIVCSANKLKDQTLLVGIRHWDHLMHAQLDNLKNLSEGDEISIVEDHRQGFVDQWGNFLERKDAWIVAERQNQIIRKGPGYSGPDLYSENLY